ncbi:MAG: nicotinate-nucleotide adenylyltransferase [Kiritimatiellaeota bacterium]|nr:nicotinate-nucleotide adenylyltransferase [Kiritimatiellota bacterium]
MKVGILGGTFDPIHWGHIMMAHCAMEAFGLDKVLFMPARLNPLKDGGRQVEDRHRVAMVRLALQGTKNMRVALDELRRPPPSFTVDTIRHLKGRHPTWDIYFILGMDSLNDLAKWRCHKTLLRLCTFIPIERPGVKAPPKRIPGLTAAASRAVLRNVIAGRLMDISSTQVRRKVAKGQAIRYAVPRTVAQYIHKHRLYTPS